MAKSEFRYVTYIRTTPEKLWKALTDPKIISKYWFGLKMETDGKPGSTWKGFFGNELLDSGKILQSVPGKKLVRSWRNEWDPALKREGLSRCTYEMEKMGACTKLTVFHSMARPRSKFIKAVTEGWPLCLSNLKSLLETGKVVQTKPPGHE